MTSIPLPGYNVCEVDREDHIDRDHVFKIHHHHQKKFYLFQAENKDSQKRYVNPPGMDLE